MSSTSIQSHKHLLQAFAIAKGHQDSQDKSLRRCVAKSSFWKGKYRDQGCPVNSNSSLAIWSILRFHSLISTHVLNRKFYQSPKTHARTSGIQNVWFGMQPLQLHALPVMFNLGSRKGVDTSSSQTKVNKYLLTIKPRNEGYSSWIYAITSIILTVRYGSKIEGIVKRSEVSSQNE